MSWASVPARLNAQAVKLGRRYRPAAARKALRRVKSAVPIAVASQVNQPEIMIMLRPATTVPWHIQGSGRTADRGAVLADNAVMRDAARGRVLLHLHKPVLGLGDRCIDTVRLAVPMVDRLCRVLPA
jgi:hypothetical protein